MASKYSYLAKNTILFTISSFGSKILAFLLVPFYTNILSTEEYGTADLVTTTSSLLVFVVTITIADAVLRFAIDGTEKRKGVFGFGLRVVLFGSGITGLILFALSMINPFQWDRSLYLFLFLTIFTSGLNQLISNYLRAIDRIPAVAIMGIMVTFFTIACNLILLLVFKTGVVGYLISFVMGYTLSTIYGLIIIIRHDRKSIREICDRETRKSMVMYSLPLIFNGVAWWMNNSLDRYFIIYFCGVATNGLYAVASKIPTIISMVSQIFIQAWNLSAIKEFDQEDKEGFFSNIYCLYNFVLVASCSVLILLNIPLARILFSRDFFIAWEYSSVLVLTAVFAALSGYFGSVFVAIKNSKIFAVSTLIAAAINALLNWILIPKYGALGGAVATAISFFVVWMVRYICASRYIKMKVYIYRDLITYVLLIIQIVLEHMDGHGYIWQGFILVAILLMYNKQIIQIFWKIRGLMRGFIKNTEK